VRGRAWPIWIRRGQIGGWYPQPLPGKPLPGAPPLPPHASPQSMHNNVVGTSPSLPIPLLISRRITTPLMNHEPWNLFLNPEP
jgi:hypothetical protein